MRTISTLIFLFFFINCNKKVQEEPFSNDIFLNRHSYLTPGNSIVKIEESKPFIIDTIVDGEKYKRILYGWKNNRIIFQYNSKYGENKPKFISTDTITSLSNDSSEYWSSFVLSPNLRYIYMSRYYTTLDITDLTVEILRFGGTYILDMQKGIFVKFSDSYDLGDGWTINNQWVISSSDKELAFDAELDELE